MIVDANLLVYAVDLASPWQRRAQEWLAGALEGDVRVGLPWQTLGAFVRLTTNARMFPRPMDAARASALVDGWLASPAAWVPPATDRTWRIYADLARRHHVTGNLVPDAQLAALAIENGVPVYSADSDFARFDEVRRINPLRD